MDKLFIWGDSLNLLTILFFTFFQKENFKNKNYDQISLESCTRISGLEDQVFNLVLEDQVKSLEAKLFATCSEFNTKDNLVKQHTKLAEEAVSGSTHTQKYLNTQSALTNTWDYQKPRLNNMNTIKLEWKNLTE